MRWLAPVLAAAVFAAPAFGQEPRDVYPGELDKREPALGKVMARLESLVAEEAEAAVLLDQLLIRTADPGIGALLTRAEAKPAKPLKGFDGKVWIGLRTRLLQFAARAPSAPRAAFRARQTKSAALALRSQRPPDRDRLVAAYPLAPVAGQAARKLWEQAFEAGDLPACLSLSSFLRTFHPALGQPLAAREALLVAARRAPAGPRLAHPRFPVRLVEVARHKLPSRSDSTEQHITAVPTWIGDRVVVSNGAAIRTFTADGRAAGSIPLEPTTAGNPPPASSSFQGFVASWGGVGFAVQALEPWQTPGRAWAASGEDGDPTFAGRYYSLLAFDVRRARILWWDGDAGPVDDPKTRVEGPPGGRLAPPALRRRLGRAHVLATAADAQRVYVAFTVKSEDPELYVMAYQRDAQDGRLVLRPAWPAPTYLGSTERKGSSEDEPVAPEVAAALRLDGQGRLVVTTDVRLTACLDVRRGGLTWVHVGRKAAATPPRRNPFRPARNRRPLAEFAPRPALLRRHPQAGQLAIFTSGQDVVAVRLADGAPAWRQPRSDSTRLLAGKDWVLAYGGRDQIVIGLDGRQRFRSRASRTEACVGRGVLHGSMLYLPIRGLRRVLRIQRLEIGPLGARIARRGAWPLPATVRDRINLLATPQGFVVASRRQVVFVKWVE